MSVPRHRNIEDGLAVLGGFIAASYALGVEILPHVVATLRAQCVLTSDHGIPWGVAMIVLACILPKTIGRATAGKVWEAVATRIAGMRLSGAGKPPEDE